MKQKRPLFLVVTIMVLLASIWLIMFIATIAQPKTLDQRVREVAIQLKCPVCEGESVADSSSGLAQQMRATIREQLQTGKSEQEVIQSFVQSYGQQIVWVPSWQGFTLLAWLVPIVLLLAGATFMFFTLRRWHTSGSAQHATIEESEDEQGLASIDAVDAERYQALLERELAEEDPLFTRARTEAK